MPKREVVWVYDICTFEAKDVVRLIKGARPFFVPMTELPMFKKTGRTLAKAYSEIGCYLPVNIDMTENEIKSICERVII